MQRNAHHCEIGNDSQNISNSYTDTGGGSCSHLLRVLFTNHKFDSCHLACVVDVNSLNRRHCKKKHLNSIRFTARDTTMHRNRFRGNRGHQQRNDRKADSVVTDEDNPVVISFRQYATELCEKHDRYERIIKLSRDITIESKRLIFLLHTVDTRKPNHEKILDEARSRLAALCTTNFASIAKELQNLDPYQYARAYSAGLQEFVEAWTYFEYLSKDAINDWNDLQTKLTYDVAEVEPPKLETLAIDEPTPAPEPIDEKPNAESVKTILCLVQPVEFMLGLADLSGEVMRKCVNSLGNGDIDACFNVCNFLQNLYSG